MSLNTIAINQRMDKFDGHHSVWLFGYASLIFKPDFPFLEQRPASIDGWTRRFWQGSHDHRGTPEAPGRVATLVPQAGASCAGMAYLITPEVFAHLDHREKNGYLRLAIAIHFDDGSSEEGLVYVAADDNAAFLGAASERDIDLIAPMAARRMAIAAVTLTTLDPAISRTLEPRAAAPARRLRTIRTLTDAGVQVRVSVAPVIPFVTEPDLERVLEAAHAAGAVSAHYVVLRLPWEVSPLFQQWLQAHFPERAQRVMNRVREMRGGKDYDGDFRQRMSGEGVWADLIRQRFVKTVKRLGMNLSSGRFGALDVTQFRRPVAAPAAASTRARGPARAASNGQLDLFGAPPGPVDTRR